MLGEVRSVSTLGKTMCGSSAATSSSDVKLASRVQDLQLTPCFQSAKRSWRCHAPRVQALCLRPRASAPCLPEIAYVLLTDFVGNGAARGRIGSSHTGPLKDVRAGSPGDAARGAAGREKTVPVALDSNDDGHRRQVPPTPAHSVRPGQPADEPAAAGGGAVNKKDLEMAFEVIKRALYGAT